MGSFTNCGIYWPFFILNFKNLLTITSLQCALRRIVIDLKAASKYNIYFGFYGSFSKNIHGSENILQGEFSRVFGNSSYLY